MWGKVFGALIGAAAGMLLAWSPIVAVALAIVGAALGHFVIDREPSAPKLERPPSVDELLGDPRPAPRPRRRAPPPPPPPKKATLEQETLAELLCPIFIEVARCDGPVVQSEVRTIREFFQQTLAFDDAGSEAVRVALKAALGAPATDVEELVKRARVEVKPSLRLDVVRALYDMGLADAALARSEIDTLKRVVGSFNLSEEQLQQITKAYFGAGTQHFETLGLDDSATDEEIKTAFRRLAAENHPDRAATLGPKEAEAAANRFRLVKEAYEELRKIRGF